MSTDPVQLAAWQSQNSTVHDSHVNPHECPQESSSPGPSPSAMVLLYGFVCIDDIRDTDEQAEVLSNVRDLMSPFGSVETGTLRQ